MRSGLLLLFMFFGGPVFADDIETVLIDALHPAALSQKTSPALDRLIQSGRHTLEGQSVTPLQTLIAHTSEDYLDELSIDTMLAPLLDEAAQRGRYLVLVTSDHAGHGRLHGTLHPEDFKLSLIMAARHPLPPLAPGVFPITELKRLLQSTLVAAEK